MKNNKDILNEAFFKKATSYEEKRAKSMPQYSPVDLKKSAGYTSNTVVPGAAYQVTDTDEVKRRLSGAFGVMFGNNNVRSMASRAIKEFPIIISDAVEPETAIMIKKLVEEQYAEYINLLISNQVVNLADYTANDEEGNIAIQALDSISGADFRRSRIADKAAKSGNIDADTVFQNIPLYNLLRENQMELKTGDCITDALLENAIVIPSAEVEKLIEFFDYNSEEIADLNEEPLYPWDRYATAPIERDPSSASARNTAKLRQYMMDDEDLRNNQDLSGNVLNRDMTTDAKRGFQGLDSTGKEIYTKLTTGDIVLDKDRFDQAINRSVGELLTRPENVEIRDKFEKATFLLQSKRISGLEYYQYLTLRLGIPVSDAARLRLVKEFKIADIRKYGQGATEGEGKHGYVISKAERKAIAQNRVPTERVVKMITGVKLKDVLADTAFTATGAGMGALTGAAVAAIIGSAFTAPVIIGAAVGGGAFLLARLIKRLKIAKQEKTNLQKIQGWERVEQLIEEMERQQAEIRKELSSKDESFKFDTVNNPTLTMDHGEKVTDQMKIDFFNQRKELMNSKEDYIKSIEDTNRMIKNALRESVELGYKPTFREFFNVNKENTTIFNESVIFVAEESQKDEHLKAEILTEKTLAKTSMPLTVKYVEKKDNKDILVTPSFMARDTYAYGSTEIDRKALKDRRYNQPLIMTVKFKERFDDGKYSDNELTAVIGILGKIIRVPSNEMEYILKESANGKTIEGIFSSGDIKDTVADMFSMSKISKDLKNLPQSADIWRNLEKVTTLAAANKLSGRRNGNISNAHIVFSQKEVDAVRNETGIDFLKDVKKSVALMKRYSAFTLMIANDAGQRMSILDDQDNLSWNVLPYSALSGKDGGDQLSAALAKMARL